VFATARGCRRPPRSPGIAATSTAPPSGTDPTGPPSSPSRTPLPTFAALRAEPIGNGLHPTLHPPPGPNAGNLLLYGTARKSRLLLHYRDVRLDRPGFERSDELAVVEDLVGPERSQALVGRVYFVQHRHGGGEVGGAGSLS
jgi:hypothetical protein